MGSRSKFEELNEYQLKTYYEEDRTRRKRNKGRVKMRRKDGYDEDEKDERQKIRGGE